MIRLGIIGAGGMANTHAEAFANIKGARVVACCDVDAGRARAFAKRHGIARTYARAEDLLADKAVDAVANVTPDAAHGAVAVAACRAGKHILSEKPLAVSIAEGRRMVAAARKAGVINMVNFSYRNAAALHAVAARIARGDIGRVLHFEASYLQCWLSSPVWGDWRKTPALAWRLSTRRGSGGALGDIGCHLIDATRLLVGEFATFALVLKTFSKGVPGETLDGWPLDANDAFAATATLVDGGGLGVLHSSRWATGRRNSLSFRIYGDKGGIEIDLDQSYTRYRGCLGKDAAKAAWRDYEAPATPNMYARFIKAVRTGNNDASDFANALAVQRRLEGGWRGALSRMR